MEGYPEVGVGEEGAQRVKKVGGVVVVGEVWADLEWLVGEAIKEGHPH